MKDPTTNPEDRRDGRSLRGVVRVVVQCASEGGTCTGGHPCVVMCYPLRRRTGKHSGVAPFPTLYWLACPRLRAAVACLERDGVIAILSAELARDAHLRAELQRDHERYIQERWALISPSDRELIAAHGLTEHFQERGIGGMTNRAAVKCLHLHLAHHLASSNVLGALLVERYGLRPCAAESHDALL